MIFSIAGICGDHNSSDLDPVVEVALHLSKQHGEHKAEAEPQLL